MSMFGPLAESRIAGGTINPCRFIQTDPAAPMLGALQCSGPGVPIIGIAWESTNQMPGTVPNPPQGYPAATIGQAVGVMELTARSMIVVGSGYTVEPDNLLVSDASGNAIPYNPTSNAVQWIGARAIEGGLPGTPIRCVVYTVPYGKAS